jgi:hypothetical protein
MEIKRAVWVALGVGLLTMAPVGSPLANGGTPADCGICHTMPAPEPYALRESGDDIVDAATRVRILCGSRMSRWCDCCHGGINQPEGGLDSPFSHPPADANGIPASIYGNHNYHREVDGMGGATECCVFPGPSEGGHAGAEYGEAKVLAGDLPATPAVTTRVMCRSCHRAHVRGFDHLQRPKNAAELLFNESRYEPGGHLRDAASALCSDPPATAFAAHQRKLCYNCHGRE